MSWSTLRLLFIHEMRMLLRSRRTIITSVVLPLIMMPAMIIGSRYAQRQQETRIDQTTFEYVVVGPWAEQARQLIKRYKDAPEFKNVHVHEQRVGDAPAALASGKLHFYVRTLSVDDANKDVADDLPDPPGAPPSPQRAMGVPALQIVYRGNQEIAHSG